LQTDRCEGDIYKYYSITNRQLPRRTVLPIGIYAQQSFTLHCCTSWDSVWW